MIDEFGASAAGDAGIIFACQAVEHYEINRYGTMHAWATRTEAQGGRQAAEGDAGRGAQGRREADRLAESGENHAGIIQTAAKAA